MKKLTKEQAEIICYKWDAEGPWYALENGYLKDLIGTEYEKIMLVAKTSMSNLEEVINGLKEKFNIDDS